MRSSELHQRVEGYLTLRSSLGYKVNSADRNLLQGFTAFVEQHELPITAEMTLTWACGSHGLSAATRAWRLSRLRGFLTYMRSFWPETEVPGRGLLAAVHRKVPYIYSPEEIAKLLHASHLIKERGSPRFTQRAMALRAQTCETLFGLLASTGLRVGEAIRLDLDDVRLHDVPPNLLVRETKFRKTRVVPLHQSVADRLSHYIEQCRGLGFNGLTHAFFISERGDRLRHGWISRAWRALLASAGVRPLRDAPHPTVHSIRHSFAVHRLLEWQRRGVNVTAMIPHLSVYMGHVEPQSTYWYLTATPELLGLAAERFEQFVGRGEGL